MDTKNHTDKPLAILGHEIRNSLHVLNQALEIWSMSAHGTKLMDDLRHIIERQVRQLTGLSEDLLDESRIAQSKQELRCEELQLQRVIDDACEQISPFIDRLGHTLATSMPDEPVVIHGDASCLIQVFANLIQNAARFADRNGRLSVSLELQSERVMVRVRDNETCHLTDIFDGDGQVSEAGMQMDDGLGFGLKLVKAIVGLHQGSITVESNELGQGSEFTVSLPLWNESARNSSIATHPIMMAAQTCNSRPLPAYRIVVVGDDDSSREFLARLLRRLGQSVTIADNGEEAIQMVLEKRPEVVFLDLMMHEMDGYEIARRLRESPDLDEMVLIALSGSGDEIDKTLAFDAGVNKYLVKPISITTLAGTLGEISMNQVHQF